MMTFNARATRWASYLSTKRRRRAAVEEAEDVELNWRQGRAHYYLLSSLSIKMSHFFRSLHSFYSLILYTVLFFFPINPRVSYLLGWLQQSPAAAATRTSVGRDDSASLPSTGTWTVFCSIYFMFPVQFVTRPGQTDRQPASQQNMDSSERRT